MHRYTLVLAFLLALGAVQATAQGGPVIGEERLEITPFAGYRTGGGFSVIADGPRFDIDNGLSYGGLVDYNLRRNNFKLELLFSRQDSNVKAPTFVGPDAGKLGVEYYQAGVLQEVGNPGARWFIAALVGATRVAPRGFDQEVHFSASLGGGLKTFLSRRVGLRFDGRAYATFVGGSTSAFCRGGSCVFLYPGSTFWQGDFTGGVILAF